MLRRLVTGLFLIAGLALLSACESDEERAEKHFQTALQLLEDGDQERAVIELRNVFQLDGFHEEARETYAALQRERGETNEAFRQYLRLIEQYPENFNARLALAEMSIAAGDWEEAERDGRAAADLRPEDPGVRAIVVNLDYRDALEAKNQDGMAAAYEAAAELLEEHPDARLAHRVVIDQLLQRQDWDGALEAIDAAIEHEPERQDLRNLRLGVLNQIGDEDAIVEELQAMVEQFPEDNNVRDTLLRWYMYQNDADAAEAFLRDTIDPNAETPDNQVQLIEFLTEVRGRDAARAELDKILESGTPHDATFRALRAALIFDAGEKDEAISEMERLLEGAEPTADVNDARVTLAHMLVANDNPVLARSQIEMVLENDSSHVEANKLKATWLIEDDETDEAIAVLREALGEAPRDPELMTLLARAHERVGHTTLMAEMLSLAVEASGSAPEESLRYANYLAESDREIAAESVLLDALRLQPENITILARLGSLYIQLEDWGRTQGVIDKLETLSAGTDIANELTARMLDAQGRQDALMSFLERLEEEGDGPSGATLAVVRSLVARDDLDGALSHIESALEEKPEDVILRSVHAAVLVLHGRTDEAEAEYRDVLEDAPKNEGTWLALYRLQLTLDDQTKAAAVLDDALEELPENPQLLWAKAERLQKDGDVDGAIAVYDALYERFSDSAVVANNLASLLAEHSDDPEDLERAWRIARRLINSEEPAFQDTFGWITSRRGDHREAFKYLIPAAQALPTDPYVQYHLAATYASAGQNAEALERFLVVQSLEPPQKIADIAEAEIARLTALVEGDSAEPATENN